MQSREGAFLLAASACLNLSCSHGGTDIRFAFVNFETTEQAKTASDLSYCRSAGSDSVAACNTAEAIELFHEKDVRTEAGTGASFIAARCRHS